MTGKGRPCCWAKAFELTLQARSLGVLVPSARNEHDSCGLTTASAPTPVNKLRPGCAAGQGGKSPTPSQHPTPKSHPIHLHVAGGHILLTLPMPANLKPPIHKKGN